MQWILTPTLIISMYWIALAFGLSFRIWSKAHGLQTVWGSRESTSGFHIIKKWAVLLQGLLFCLSLVELVLPGKDQWVALEDSVCIHKLTKNIQGQLLNALIIGQTCSFAVYRAVASTLEEQCKNVDGQGAHFHTGILEKQTAWYFIILHIFLRKCQCAFSLTSDDSSDFCFGRTGKEGIGSGGIR